MTGQKNKIFLNAPNQHSELRPEGNTAALSVVLLPWAAVLLPWAAAAAAAAAAAVASGVGCHAPTLLCIPQPRLGARQPLLEANHVRALLPALVGLGAGGLRSPRRVSAGTPNLLPP